MLRGSKLTCHLPGIADRKGKTGKTDENESNPGTSNSSSFLKELIRTIACIEVSIREIFTIIHIIYTYVYNAIRIEIYIQSH